MDIKKQLKLQKKVDFLNEIKFDNKKFVKAYKVNKNGIKYYYFLIDNDNTFKEVTDSNLLEYFKEMYETKSSNIIY